MTTKVKVTYMKLSACSLAMAFGLLWGLSVLITALIAGMFDWGNDFIKLMSSIYIGYSTSYMGALLGLLWGFVDGFIGGFLLAVLYNLCLCCDKCSKICGLCCCK